MTRHDSIATPRSPAVASLLRSSSTRLPDRGPRWTGGGWTSRWWWGVCACLALAGPAGRAAAERPRLIVVVSVDQFSYEYLERFHANFAADGIVRRVEQEGAWYTECYHRHAFTLTGPGHATLLTGCYPARHGVIDNNWLDRSLRKMVYCVEDPAFPVVGARGEAELKGVSPLRLDAPTVGDELKAATGGEAKVLGVTIKDRASVLMAGRKADAVYWYDITCGAWVTSRYYRERLPEYLEQLNSSLRVDEFAGREWQLLLPADKYRLNYPDDNPFEESYEGLGQAFPHRLDAQPGKNLYKQLQATPWGNEFTLEVTRQVIEREQLGQDDCPDLLLLGMSSNDFVGHTHGPHSLEVEDMVYRTDRLLGDFTRFLDERVGKDRWTLVMSADHAVGPIPEYARTLGLPAQRFPLGTLDELTDRVEQELRTRFGALPGRLTYVEKLEYAQVYLRPEAARGDPKRLAQLADAVGDYLRRQPTVAFAVTRAQLLAPPPILPPLDAVHPELIAAGSTLEEMLRRSFHPQRSGDVLYVLHPYNLQTKLRASHGSPWKFDAHVPLLLVGCGIQAGRFERPISPAAIASTLARLLDIDPPAKNQEHPAAEALRDNR